MSDTKPQTPATDETTETPTIESLTVDKAHLAEHVETLTAERDAALEKVADLEKQLAAKPKGKVAAGTAPAKPRKAGPMKDGAAVTGADLRELLAAAGDGEVEIVFSDGKTELAGVPPVRADGDVWKEHSIGLMLRDAVEITGPAQPTSLGGYALFVDGKQVTWTPRDTTPIAPGSKVRLADDIYFA